MIVNGLVEDILNTTTRNPQKTIQIDKIYALLEKQDKEIQNELWDEARRRVPDDLSERLIKNENINLYLLKEQLGYEDSDIRRINALVVYAAINNMADTPSHPANLAAIALKKNPQWALVQIAVEGIEGVTHAMPLSAPEPEANKAPQASRLEKAFEAVRITLSNLNRALEELHTAHTEASEDERTETAERSHRVRAKIKAILKSVDFLPSASYVDSTRRPDNGESQAL